jgi:hypothetical protein
MPELFTEPERGELLLALRELRTATQRKQRNSERKLASWDDERERGNPGYRQFLYTSIEARMERLERIASLIKKVNHA